MRIETTRDRLVLTKTELEQMLRDAIVKKTGREVAEFITIKDDACVAWLKPAPTMAP